ncbi:Ig-like domain-containing protein [Paenibacillus rubinfantis]|uniref:Ig-like domain-containing protein n=1 Tax=Paenibacillus rubinfantis TaxID=1720296 RepID=UPI00073F2ADF|nr:Ig-like domain-containing protein [Paenibacillus rubinfantis]
MKKKSWLTLMIASLLFTLSPVATSAVSATGNGHPADLGNTGHPRATAYYVATNGSDTNNGSKKAPFRTLEKARDAIRELKAAKGLPAGGVTVYLREGRYERSASFELREQDSGAAGKPITYAAYPGEKVVLSGSERLEKSVFVPVTDEAVRSRIISPEAREKVLVADLAALGITDYGNLSRHGYYLANDLSEVPPMELYVNGQGMTLARWPNEGTVQMDEILDPGPTRKDPNGEVHTRGGTFTYTYDRPQYWMQADDIWLDGIFGYSWEWSYNKIASIDPAAKTITLRYGEMSGIFKNWYPDFHFAQNLLEEIDMPGEYYIDRQAGKLYFLPNAEFMTADPAIEVTMLKSPMINALNASYINFSELILENGRDSAAVFMGGSHMRIENSEIRNFTNSGVLVNTQSRFYYNDFDGVPGTDHAIENTHLHHIGGTAVTLTGGNKTTLSPGRNVVRNSHIHDFAYYHKAYNPGVLLSGVGNRMEHNELHDAPHPGVLIFGNDHVVEYNNIYDVCKTFSDLGAIYMNAGETPQERGTVIRRNYFHHIGETEPGVEGVYPDNFTMGLKIDENIFYKMGNSAIKNNGGSHILSRNNIFVDSKVPYDYADLYLGDDPDDQVPKHYMPKWLALFAANNNFVGTPYLEKYPELADFFTENRYYPDTNTFQGNVIYNPVVPRSSTTNENGAYDKFGLIQYANNWVTAEDPGFVDLAGGDLSLRPDAEVFQQIPGFPNIPFDQIGIQGKAGTTLGQDSYPVQGVAVYDDHVTVDRWKTVKLRTAVLPWNADNPVLTFTSADPAIASVDGSGVVTGQAVGQTAITVASAENPQLTAMVNVTVEAGDGVMDFTDFESGANGWPQDANRSIVKEGDNRWYKVLNGATALSSKSFSEYELSFKLKTPETIGNAATLYIFDRQVGSGSTRVGYKTRADGSSAWLLYDPAWAILKEVKLPGHDLQPNTEYEVKMLVKGGDISVYVDGGLRLKAMDPGHNAEGKVGFYVAGVSHMLFDDIQFKALSTELAGILPVESQIRMIPGEQRQMQLTFDPSDTPETEVTWQTADPAVATVDAMGVVNAVYAGETIVMAVSAVNPLVKADISITVSNVMHETDFENGGNGWPVDPNRSIAADPDGNRRYKILNGATGLLDRDFESYVLEFTLKTPTVMPENGGVMYIFDRQDAAGSTRIGYRTRADGTSGWILYDTSWQKLAEADLPGLDLQPDTEYAVKVVVKEGDVAAYVDGALRVAGTDPNHRPRGKVGFYVSGFDYLLFDDIRVSLNP